MSTTIEEGGEVADLDASAVLEAARDNEREIRRRESLQRRLAAHWADLHPRPRRHRSRDPGGPGVGRAAGR